jgi:predicted glutamine amidotransferase
MCVIAVKKRGVALPSESNIKAMWNANKDGAGIMYTYNGKVYVEKGFMKLDDLLRALTDLDKKINIKNTPLVMHFRITTHGGTSPYNTHPFPVSSNEEHLKALDLSCNLAMVHNGIINSVDTPTGSTMSDTMIYISDVLAPLYMLNKDFYRNSFGKTLMENTIGWSKLVFLDKNGELSMVGDFKNGTTDDTKDILYSNLNHDITSRFDKSIYTYESPSYKSVHQDLPFDDFEQVKAVPVGYAVGSFYDGKVYPVYTNDTYFTDKGGYIYFKANNSFYESEEHLGIYKLDDLGNPTEIDYNDLESKPITAQITYKDNYDK